MINNNRLKLGARVAPWAMSGAALLCTSMANAAPCSSTPNLVVLSGSTAAKNFVSPLAAALQTLTPPINIAYYTGSDATYAGSCNGVKGLLSGADQQKLTGIQLTTYDATGAAAGTCDVADGTPIDIGFSDVFPSTCGLTLPAGTKDFHGPIQSMNFVVPPGSNQTSISQEAAYETFGFPTGMVAPWTGTGDAQGDSRVIRENSSGTLLMLATAIGVDGIVHAWHGYTQTGGALIATALKDAAHIPDPNTAIGIMSSGDAEGNGMTKLAFKATGQDCGYAADSDPSTTVYDKHNVRDGHYYIWGPVHMMARVDANGAPIDVPGGAPKANVTKVLYAITGQSFNGPVFTPTQTQGLIAGEAKKGIVPECAMRVSRDSEIGPMSSWAPTHSCSCAWEASATSATPSNCTACPGGDSDCTVGKMTQDGALTAAGKCNYGFCEVQ